jgi:V8-like Glu-specific endopeptidase
LSLFLPLATASCDTEEPDHWNTVKASSQESTPRTWAPDLSRRASIPEDWTFIGHGELCDDCVPEYPAADDASMGEPGLAAADAEDAKPGTATQSRKMIAFNVQTGEEYEIEISGAMMDALAEAAEDAVGWLPEDAGSESEWLASGHAAPTEPGSYDPDGFSAETPRLPGWSNGVDTRKRSTDAWAIPGRMTGQMNGGTFSGCTGTLVGPRLVATAAHCLWNQASQSWSPVTFRPGRTGTCSSGWCEPFGAHGTIWYFTPAEFRVPGQSQSYYNTHDYGFFVTENYIGNSLGYMGMTAFGATQLLVQCNSVFGACWNRGWPACGFVENANTPDGCTQGWPYQSEQRCEIGSIYGGQGPDGWTARFRANCDTGRGHSGGSAYVTSGSQFSVVGITITQACGTCSSSDHYPNGFRRVTPDVTAWRQYFLTHPVLG